MKSAGLGCACLFNRCRRVGGDFEPDRESAITVTARACEEFLAVDLGISLMGAIFRLGLAAP
jgi:hypothetical protein